MPVVTRFAPSPTGLLHIGGARTALFNWLYARGQAGRFLLRIEDTDRARSTEAAVAAILDGLEWLGLTPDEPPIFQFARAARHAEAARDMVAQGKAFRCYVSAEALEARRAAADAAREALAAAKAAGAPAAEIAALQVKAQELAQAFRSPYRDGDRPPPSADAPFVVRLRAPDTGVIINDDLVQGEVRVAAKDLDDLVLLRADGAPTYMLAVVVDDHDMGVTHVIRGDDHLTNAARQIPIYQALGWTPPRFAHVPLIHGADGKKLSKRHGAQAVQEFRAMGMLPEAVRAYLLRLGWSHGDDEIISMEDAARWFDPKDINRAPSRLDFEKLAHVNGRFLRQAEPSRLATLALAHGVEALGWTVDADAHGRLTQAMPALSQRARTIPELAAAAQFLMARRPLALDAAAQKALKDDVRSRLRRLASALAAIEPWAEQPLAEALKAFAAAEGVGMGQIGPGLRAAVTGGAAAPDLAQCLALLGRAEALGRIADQSMDV